MGLASRKTKQRIAADPRNLTWSKDLSKFGAKYLQSLGWSAGEGLGVSGEGRTSNLKIHQKLDLMGIGANRKGSGDDAGWRGGRDFEGLLARLNQTQEEMLPDNPLDGRDVPNIFSDGSLEAGDDSKEAKTPKEADANTTRKRRRLASQGHEIDARETKRKRKEEKREKKKAEKAARKRKDCGDPGEYVVADMKATEVPTGASEVVQAMNVTPRYRAHRARNIASKRLAATSVTGMNEILGIVSSASSVQTMSISSVPFPVQISPSRRPLELDTSSGFSAGVRSALGGGLGFGGAKDDAGMKPTTGDDLFTKSGKSVADYFAEKLRMKGEPMRMI